ncbi:hypothetical protein [Bradyrhizobium monzae]|uniref:hypothetical protein n=1 Tax=Bradyrhizobium sp. Oc8 TaxID=2876780 RepID=UPI001F27CA02|nr:hypothetical protein [Bradyrhizobium sp. Oc8]
MVISSKLPARGYRVDGKAAETIRLREGFGFDGPDVMPARLNQTLMGPSDWVHLREIVVIHVEIRPLTCGDAPVGRSGGRLPDREGADISPATPNHPFSLQGQDHGHRTHFLDHQARRDRA